MTERTDLKMRYFDDAYQTLTNIGEQKPDSVVLVQRKTDRRIFVRKKISREAVGVYDRMKTIASHNIARIYDVACDQNYGIVIEEFVNGTTLANHLQESGILPEAEVCTIVMDLCHALSLIHSMGIVHRDIKPENIMISNDGIIKLIDFGIARVIKEEQPQDTTILGTEGYAAPEQFGYAQTDARTDIYALGVLMNKLLTDMMPPKCFYSAQPMHDIIKRCMAIDAENRFQSVQELRMSVEEVYRTINPDKGETLQAEKLERIIRFLPGFATNRIPVNVAATMGYLFLVFCTIVCMQGYHTSVKVFLLELLAVFIYLWAATLVAFNVAGWDRRLYPFCQFPKPVRIAIRIILWFLIFGFGVEIENYVKYQLLGMMPLK